MALAGGGLRQRPVVLKFELVAVSTWDKRPGAHGVTRPTNLTR